MGLFERINWVDIVAVILLLRITYVSSRVGVGKQILPLILLVFIQLISLYNYKDIASFFVGRYDFSQDLTRFLSYFFITVIFLLIYVLLSRIMGFCFPRGEVEPDGAAIEKIGGAFLGFLRSLFIIGMILIGLLLAPVRFIEAGAMDSFLGIFYVKANLKIYSAAAKLIFKDEKISYSEELEGLLSKKEKYLFEKEE